MKVAAEVIKLVAWVLLVVALIVLSVYWVAGYFTLGNSVIAGG